VIWLTQLRLLFLCIYTRSLGPEISRIRSTTTDEIWSSKNLARMKAGGNQKCREFLESAGLALHSRCSIRQKYTSFAARRYQEHLGVQAAAGSMSNEQELPREFCSSIAKERKTEAFLNFVRHELQIQLDILPLRQEGDIHTRLAFTQSNRPLNRPNDTADISATLAPISIPWGQIGQSLLPKSYSTLDPVAASKLRQCLLDSECQDESRPSNARNFFGMAVPKSTVVTHMGRVYADGGCSGTLLPGNDYRDDSRSPSSVSLLRQDSTCAANGGSSNVDDQSKCDENSVVMRDESFADLKASLRKSGAITNLALGLQLISPIRCTFIPHITEDAY